MKTRSKRLAVRIGDMWTNPKSRFPIVFLVFLGFVALIFAFAAHLFGATSMNGTYAVVTMVTGETYFGRLSVWPRWKLTDPFALQRTMNPLSQTAQLSLAPLTQAFWQPTNELHLNRRQIVTWARINDASELIPYLENPTLLSGGQPIRSINVAPIVPQTEPAPTSGSEQ